MHYNSCEFTILGCFLKNIDQLQVQLSQKLKIVRDTSIFKQNESSMGSYLNATMYFVVVMMRSPASPSTSSYMEANPYLCK